MVLVAAVLVVALAAGLVRGGRLTHLGRVRLRGAPLVVLAVAAQLSLVALTAAAGPPSPLLVRLLLGASYAALLAFVGLNRHLPGMPLVLTGLALNAAVVVVNAGMPVAPGAVRAVGGDDAAIVVGLHRPLTDADLLPWLADVIPLRPLRTVVSVGDVVLATGVGILGSALVRGLPGARRRAGVPADERRGAKG